jgi:hypothetical protein
MIAQKELPNNQETTHMRLMNDLEMTAAIVRTTTKQVNNDCMKDQK